MAIDIGFDESGSGDVLLVGMQVAIVSRARKFRNYWRSELSKVNVPYFHSKEFGNFNGGVFTNLNRPERTKLLNTLCSGLRERLGAGVTFKVTVSKWNSRTDDTFRSKWGTAYTFLTQMLLLAAYKYMDANDLGRDVNILIEDGHRHSAQALQHFLAMKRDGHPLISILTVGLGSKADHPILQAADMLAYSEWQNLTDGDKEIYNQLHVSGSRYVAQYLNCDEDLVEPLVDIVNHTERDRKAWGTRKRRDNEAE